jgi:geranylgeranyl pyrophosphate synthase
MENGECTQRVEAVSVLNRMILQTASGQNLDVTNQQSEEGYWAVTRAKSSPYFGAALFIGALFGGGSLEIARELWNFGCIYGEMMQIHDDLNDCLASPANVDWLNGRSPLPILFAQSVAHPDRARFLELRGLVEDPEALEEAQAILVRCGAISYCVNELLSRHSRGIQLLNQIELAKPELLEQLLDEVIAPVQHLFNKVGAALLAG